MIPSTTSSRAAIWCRRSTAFRGSSAIGAFFSLATGSAPPSMASDPHLLSRRWTRCYDGARDYRVISGQKSFNRVMSSSEPLQSGVLSRSQAELAGSDATIGGLDRLHGDPTCSALDMYSTRAYNDHPTADREPCHAARSARQCH